MPAVNCPNCNATLNAPESTLGRTVKCPRCQAPFTVAAGEPGAAFQPPGQHQYAAPPQHGSPYDEPPRPRRRRTREEVPTGLQLGLGIASLSVGALALPFALIPFLSVISWPLAGIGLVLGIVGVIVACTRGAGIAFPVSGAAVSCVALMVAVVWILLIRRAADTAMDVALDARNRQDRLQQQFEEELKKQLQNLDKKLDKGFPAFDGFPDKVKLDGKGPVNPKPAGPPPVVQQVNFVNGVVQHDNTLTMNDGRHAQNGRRCKVFLVPMIAGREYQIDMTSNEFDAYLYLHTPQDQYITHNDDGGGNLNSRIVHRCTQSGTYRVLAASCADVGAGRYTLRIQER